MIEEKMEELREKLHLLIVEKANYNDILNVSQQLDEYITKYVSTKMECDVDEKSDYSHNL